MLFSEKFLIGLRDDPIGGALKMIETVRANIDTNGQEWMESDYETFLEAYALINELIAAKLLPVSGPGFSISGDLRHDCKNINQYLQALETHCVKESSKMKVVSLQAHFKIAIGAGFAYEFSQGDLDRVQILVNQIRDLISSTEGLQDEHKNRLLARLEKLQSEMHKKVSDLDRFWGLIGDAGVVLGKLGQDAKPVVDRIKEIAEIVWQTQSRAEELPSGTQIPMLGGTKAAKSDEVASVDAFQN
jgi:uncharacterized protein YoxC